MTPSQPPTQTTPSSAPATQFLTLTAPISKPFVPVFLPVETAVTSPLQETLLGGSTDDVPDMSIHHVRADSTSSDASL